MGQDHRPTNVLAHRSLRMAQRRSGILRQGLPGVGLFIPGHLLRSSLRHDAPAFFAAFRT